MKKYEAILFDMDGTLVPMDMHEFTGGYFKLLAKKLMPFGIDPEVLVPAIWDGTGAMVKNDGSVTNDRVFWRRFEEKTGISEQLVGPACYEFYGKEFKAAKCFVKENPLAKRAVELAHEKAPIVALATNPLFPMPGQQTRMEWVDLSEKDFDLVTCYETDCYCKPNPAYFISVCERLGVAPSECLMIGNDEYEDMYACTVAGMDGYLVTDTMIESKDHPWNGQKGTFEDLITFLTNL